MAAHGKKDANTNRLMAVQDSKGNVTGSDLGYREEEEFSKKQGFENGNNEECKFYCKSYQTFVFTLQADTHAVTNYQLSIVNCQLTSPTTK